MDNIIIRLFYIWLYRRKLYNKFKTIVRRERERHDRIQMARLKAFQFRDAHDVSDLAFDSFDGIIRICSLNKRKVLWQHPKYYEYKSLISRQKRWAKK